MSSRLARHTPAFRARRPIRRESPFGPQVLSSETTRGFDEYALEVLVEPSPHRGSLLLDLSDSRIAEAHFRSSTGERARTAAYESAYLAMACVLSRDSCVGERHPSQRLVATAAESLGLSPDDCALARDMTGVYGLPGWETLDLEGVIEWCTRVRLAACHFAMFRRRA